METVTTHVPVIFWNPFEEEIPKDYTVIVWVPHYRKRDGSPVLVDWSVKAFRDYLPLKERRMVLRRLRHGIVLRGSDANPWRVHVMAPLPRPVYSLADLPMGVKPIRKLRGILTKNRPIPDWALDVSPRRVRNIFSTAASARRKTLLCFPDASDSRLKRSFELILECANGIRIRERDWGIDIGSNCVICVNPKLKHLSDCVAQIAHQHHQPANTDRGIYRASFEIIEKVP